MATIIKEGRTLKVGRDFVDAVTGAAQSHGELMTTLNTSPMPWQSTLPIADTEHVLRVAAKEDGARITYFRSQSL